MKSLHTLNNIDTRLEELTQAVRETHFVEEDLGEAVIEDEHDNSEVV